MTCLEIKNNFKVVQNSKIITIGSLRVSFPYCSAKVDTFDTKGLFRAEKFDVFENYSIGLLSSQVDRAVDQNLNEFVGKTTAVTTKGESLCVIHFTNFGIQNIPSVQKLTEKIIARAGLNRQKNELETNYLKKNKSTVIMWQSTKSTVRRLDDKKLKDQTAPNIPYGLLNPSRSRKDILAKDLPAMDLSGTSDPYVRVTLLPDKKHRLDTKVKRRTLNPRWNETLYFQGFTMQKLHNRTLHLHVFDYDRFSRDDSIGETYIELNNVDFTAKPVFWKDLTAPLKDKCGHLLTSLSYNPMTNNLTLGIIEARNLKAMDINGKSGPNLRQGFQIFGIFKKDQDGPCSKSGTGNLYYTKTITICKLCGSNELGSRKFHWLLPNELFIYYVWFPIVFRDTTTVLCNDIMPHRSSQCSHLNLRLCAMPLRL
ncbi:hypothetical protein QTP88_028691 [Uroleucon formosanum]